MSVDRDQLDRIEAKLDEVLDFRDQLLTAAGPWLKKTKYAALLVRGKG